MPLPSTTGCPIPEVVCCTTVFDIAQYILNRVYDKLIDCVPMGCDGKPMKLHRYVTLGAGDDGIGDSLTCSFLGAVPSPGSLDQAGRLKATSVFRADYDVRLRENGWPIVRTDGRQLDAPDPEIQQAIARHALSHGESMFRILRDLAVKAPTNWKSGYPFPAYASVSQLRTINPQGGMVGFSSVLTVDLPWGVDGH